MLGEHPGVTAIHGVQQGDVGAPGTPLSSAEFGRVQGSHRSTLCRASVQGWAARGCQQAWGRGSMAAGWSFPTLSSSMSFLQLSLCLHDQRGVRCKSPGDTLTTHPRKCGATLTFSARHSGEGDKPPILSCCSPLLPSTGEAPTCASMFQLAAVPGCTCQTPALEAMLFIKHLVWAALGKSMCLGVM